MIDLKKVKGQYQNWNPRLGGRGDCTLCGGANQHHEDCWWLVIGELIAEVEKVRVHLAAANNQIIESAAAHDQIIEVDENGQVHKVEWFYGFKPTPECVNALPPPIRQYIHDLETRCDPAGEIRQIAFLKESNLALRLKVDELEKQLSQYEEPTQE